MTDVQAVRGDRPPFQAWTSDQDTFDAVTLAAEQAQMPNERVALGGIDDALEYLAHNATPQTLLVDVSRSDDLFAAINRLADACQPETRVIAMGIVNDIETYRRLLQLGITEYLVKPSNPDAIATALGRARAPAVISVPASDRGHASIAVMGTRGGVGATSIAISVACELAHERNVDTVLLDLDLLLGSVAISLDLEPSRGLREILENPDRIDSLLVGSALTQESERLRVLSAEEALESEIRVNTDALKTLLDLLKEDHDTIVMDVSRRVDSLTKAALQEADVVCIVTDLSLSGMRDSKRVLELVRGSRRRSGDQARSVLLVANRVGAIAGELPQAEFERGAGVKLDFVLPYDAKAAAAAANKGKSLLGAAGSGPLKTEFSRLVAVLVGGIDDAAPPSQRSWVRRFVGS